MAFQDFINNYNGQENIGDTDGNRGQCVGLIEVYFDTLGAPHIWGNACDMPANADRNIFDVVLNSDTYVPPVGAAAVWPGGWEGSGVGHIALVAPWTDVNTLVVFEQNDRLGGGNGSCRLHSFPNYGYGLNQDQINAGWPMFIVPKSLETPDPVSAPVPAPVAPAIEPASVVEAPAPVDAPVDAPVVVPAAALAVAAEAPAVAPDLILPDLTVSLPAPIIINEVKPMNKIISFLEGKKTYIVVGILGLINYLVAGGFISIPADQLVAINGVLGALGLGAIRSKL